MDIKDKNKLEKYERDNDRLKCWRVSQKMSAAKCMTQDGASFYHKKWMYPFRPYSAVNMSAQIQCCINSCVEKVNPTAVQVGGVIYSHLYLFMADTPQNAIGEGCQSFEFIERGNLRSHKLHADGRNLSILKEYFLSNTTLVASWVNTQGYIWFHTVCIIICQPQYFWLLNVRFLLCMFPKMFWIKKINNLSMLGLLSTLPSQQMNQQCPLNTPLNLHPPKINK